MIKKKITDKKLLEHLKNIEADGKDVFLLDNEKVRATIINATEMVNKMKVNHELNFVESYILAQSYIANTLLASTVKGEDRVQLTVECGGPIGGVYTEAWACGAVRGYLKNHKFATKQEYPVNTDPLYGPGFLTVTKIIEGNTTPFTGQIMLQYGDLAKDLALYFKESEQTPSYFIIDFDVDENNRIIGAGGIFLQALPGCSEEEFKAIEEKAAKLPSLGKHLSSGEECKTFIQENFENPRHLAHSLVGFSCPCDRKNFAKHLKSMPENERKDILENGPFPLELTCLNCNSHYEFDKEELNSLLK